MTDEKKRKILNIYNAHLEKKREFDESMKVLEKETEHWIKESDRILNIIEENEKIISDLKDEFNRNSSLSLKDMSFLFGATALQCCRWLFQPKINSKFEKISKNERHQASQDGYKEFVDGRKIAEDYEESNIKSRKYPDKVNMFLLPVPYDAMIGTQKIVIPGVSELGSNIYGINHHSVTMGHDPILGYFFGTINILSRTVTFKTPCWQTNLVHLHQGSRKDQYVGREIGFIDAINRAIDSAREDITRVPAAVIRQSLHMQSDKYTKGGLPIPLLSPQKSQELLEKGWNSYELERFGKFIAKNTATVGMQAFSSMLINLIIETLHIMTYDEKVDGSFEVFQVRTRKIIMYSNVMASSSNVIYSAISRCVDNFDFGGFLVTIHRIATDQKFIEQIRDEFIYGSFKKMATLREFNLEGEDE